MRFDVLDRVAIDEQQVCQCALLHHAKLAAIGAALAGELEQFGIGPGGHDQHFRGRVVAGQAGQKRSLLLRERLREEDVGAERRLDLVFFRQVVGDVLAGEHFLKLEPFIGTGRKDVGHLRRKRLDAEPDSPFG
jgi:hypothetical protein